MDFGKVFFDWKFIIFGVKNWNWLGNFGKILNCFNFFCCFREFIVFKGIKGFLNWIRIWFKDFVFFVGVICFIYLGSGVVIIKFIIGDFFCFEFKLKLLNIFMVNIKYNFMRKYF